LAAEFRSLSNATLTNLQGLRAMPGRFDEAFWLREITTKGSHIKNGLS
jgi:hypothetical protein